MKKAKDLYQQLECKEIENYIIKLNGIYYLRNKIEEGIDEILLDKRINILEMNEFIEFEKIYSKIVIVNNMKCSCLDGFKTGKCIHINFVGIHIGSVSKGIVLKKNKQRGRKKKEDSDDVSLAWEIPTFKQKKLK